MKTYTVTNGDADTVINSERLLRNAEAARDQMQIERNAALQREATALAERDEMQRIAAIAIIISVLVISVGGVLLWLNFKKASGPTPPPPTCESPALLPDLRVARSQPRRHGRICPLGTTCKDAACPIVVGNIRGVEFTIGQTTMVASAGGIAALKVPVSIDCPPGTVSSGHFRHRLPVQVAVRLLPSELLAEGALCHSDTIRPQDWREAVEACGG